MSPCALYLLPVSTVVNGIVTMRFKSHYWGLPGGSNGNEFACNAGDLGLILGLGRSPGEGNGYTDGHLGHFNVLAVVLL